MPEIRWAASGTIVAHTWSHNVQTINGVSRLMYNQFAVRPATALEGDSAR